MLTTAVVLSMYRIAPTVNMPKEHEARRKSYNQDGMMRSKLYAASRDESLRRNEIGSVTNNSEGEPSQMKKVHLKILRRRHPKHKLAFVIGDYRKKQPIMILAHAIPIGEQQISNVLSAKM